MHNRTTHNQGFTLIEILVVIAISMILMGLVLYPVAQSFKMTRSAQAMVESQDAARHAMEQISRDLGEAMDILDYTGRSIDIPVLTSTGSGPATYISVPDAKIDFVLPKMLVHCNNPTETTDYPKGHPEGEPRDFERRDEALPACPVAACRSTDVEVRPKLPLEQDVKVVRYFLGLAYNDPNNDPNPDPTEPDFGWLSPWGSNVEAGKGNQVVLYRLEFDPSDESIFGDDRQAAVSALRAILSDPRFFYSEGMTTPSVASGASQEPFWKVWQRKARVIGVAKYQDLVDGVDSNGDKIWDALTPSVTFKYKVVDNDIFTGAYSTDKSFEYPDTAPAVYRGQFGYWLPDYGISVYRYTYGADGTPSVVIAYQLADDGNGQVIDRVEYKHNADDTWSVVDTSTTFKIYQYLSERAVPRDISPDFAEMGFTIDEVRGQANFSLMPRNGPDGDDSLSISDINPAVVNSRYKNDYDADRGSARRYEVLSTFVSGSNNYLKNATIVPGSERVVGPNMTQGAGYGAYIAYERVPFSIGDPGLNQYRIHYDTGMIFFSPVYDQDLPVIDGGAGSPLPIRVDYKVHFNREGDVVRGNYATKAAVVIHLGMRMYDPESSKPHSVDLSNTVKVRNSLR